MDEFLVSKKWKWFYRGVHLHQRFTNWLVREREVRQPERILLANWGALGDLVLSSGVIAAVRARFPGCKIGFLTSKASAVVLETCPEVDWIHRVDLWSSPSHSALRKCFDLVKFCFIGQRKIARKLIPMQYDMAIELRPFLVNLIPVFWFAKIPIRVGFTTSGNYPRLTEKIEWPGNRYLPYAYRSFGFVDSVPCLKRGRSSIVGKYVIFHLGSADARKELPVGFWKELWSLVLGKGYRVIWTGRGDREHKIIDSLQVEDNYCNRLSWTEFVNVIGGAFGVVSVDSCAIHVAAVFQVSTAVIFRSTPSSSIWMPDHPFATAFQFSDALKPEEVFNLFHVWENNSLHSDV